MLQWVRAEILGAFFNAVFLIALCVSIVLEALTRFIEPPEINNPKLILFVGCAGLFSNIMGFFVLGGHGHSHGHDHDHDHDHGHEHAHGAGHRREQDEEQAVGYGGIRSDAADENGAVGDVLPEVVVRRATSAAQRSGSSGTEAALSRNEHSTRISRTTSSRSRGHRRSSKSGHSGFASIDDISIHPASFRQDIIAASLAASSAGGDQGSDSETEGSRPCHDNWREANEESPLLQQTDKASGTMQSQTSDPHMKSKHHRRDSGVHDGHNHTKPKSKQTNSGGHNHADMGMKAMILHVIGDALGNLGVIVTALIIWLTNWPGKVYADPAVSLVITAIILHTSIPLTRATSRVLLQATPENISIQEVRQDVEALPGVVSCHHIHVWQLSDTKIVASMHLQVAFPIDSHSGKKYMELAKRARQCLHGFGIHSATIQPEFCFDNEHRHDGLAAGLRLDGGSDRPTNPDACLLECADDCEEQGCCSGVDAVSKTSSTYHGSETHSEGNPEHHHE